MDNCNFLKLTTQSNQHKTFIVLSEEDLERIRSFQNNSDKSGSANSEDKVQKDTSTLGDKVVDVWGTLSDEAIEKIYDKTVPELKSPQTSSTKLATSFKNFNAADIAKIKSVIFKIRAKINGSGKPGNTGGQEGGTQNVPDTPGGTDEPNTPTNPDVTDDPNTPVASEEPSPEPTEEVLGQGEGTGKSFITEKYNNFYNADTMFEFLSTLTNGEITKDKGITRKQLIKLTQNELAEADNNCFFGALNRIFYNTKHFNTNNDDVLSFEEIDTLFKTLGFGDELGEEPTAFLNKINSYCDEIQQEYVKLTPQKRLEFVIDKTKDYLEATGLTRQLDALNRLLGQTDTYHTGNNVVKVGQIVMADCNEKLTDSAIQSGFFSYTGGSYSLLGPQPYKFVGGTYTGNHPKAGDAIYRMVLFSSDTDKYTDKDTNPNKFDGGITLDIRYVDENYQPVYTAAKDGLPAWYELVDVFVHELTHATAYQYSNEDSENATMSIMKYFNKSEVEKMVEKGVISNSDYNYYLENIDNTSVNLLNLQENQEYMNVANRILHALSSMWGEYAAYQADADYLDSIGGDVFSPRMTTAKTCEEEKEAIIEHIWMAYDRYGTWQDKSGKELVEVYPEGKLENIIFTAEDRKNWQWA